MATRAYPRTATCALGTVVSGILVALGRSQHAFEKRAGGAKGACRARDFVPGPLAQVSCWACVFPYRNRLRDGPNGAVHAIVAWNARSEFFGIGVWVDDFHRRYARETRAAYVGIVDRVRLKRRKLASWYPRHGVLALFNVAKLPRLAMGAV